MGNIKEKLGGIYYLQLIDCYSSIKNPGRKNYLMCVMYKHQKETFPYPQATTLLLDCHPLFKSHRHFIQRSIIVIAQKIPGEGL